MLNSHFKSLLTVFVHELILMEYSKICTEKYTLHNKSCDVTDHSPCYLVYMTKIVELSLTTLFIHVGLIAGVILLSRNRDPHFFGDEFQLCTCKAFEERFFLIYFCRDDKLMHTHRFPLKNLQLTRNECFLWRTSRNWIWLFLHEVLVH